MADGLCTGDAVSTIIDKTLVKDYNNIVKCVNNDSVDDNDASENVKSFFIDSDSGKLCGKLCGAKGTSPKHEGFLEMPCSPGDEDCLKKRCADRYDSSESSDSGVAVLSCTDCSGSSTASSDITDPGSPFSTSSSHSEDSSSQSQPVKMPPTQTADHPPWPWTSGESPPLKRATTAQKSVPPSKKLKVEATAEQQSPITVASVQSQTVHQTNASPKPQCLKSFAKSAKKPAAPDPCKVQQGKITEYFKSQIKSKGLKKELSNIAIKSGDFRNPNLDKYYSLHEASKLNGAKCATKMPNDLCKMDVRTVTVSPSLKKGVHEPKPRKISPVTVPRKILPAPAKNAHPDKNRMAQGAQIGTVNLTSIRFPQEQIAYLTPAPKPLFITTATIGNTKINSIPLVNRTPPNFIPPLQKMTLSNFNCVKLNATVVPIVKLNTLPPRFNGSNLHNTSSVALSVDTAVPTIPTVKPKLSLVGPTVTYAAATPKPPLNPPAITITEALPPTLLPTGRIEHQTSCCSFVSTSSSSSSSSSEAKTGTATVPVDSDSGISSSTKDALEVCVSQPAVPVEPQKSPILSQPKTIRFPAKQYSVEGTNGHRRSDSSDSGTCRWSDCHIQFDTSGALLEHLQVNHVISQATQEQYVCLWLGCKVHGRTSCSRSWLERHVLAHAGTKPFRCIVDGCGMRFSSQLALERHVNGHFNTDSSANGSARKSLESTSIKLFKKNGKKIRYRRQPWSARMFDYFDTGVMEGLQHRLVCMTEKRTMGQIESEPGDTITLQSQILANRIETDGKKKLLVHWQPEDVLPDEWICANDYSRTKTVSIQNLQPSAVSALKPTLFPYQGSHLRKEKHRRKPVSKAS